MPRGYVPCLFININKQGTCPRGRESKEATQNYCLYSRYNLDFIRNAVAWTNTKYGGLDLQVTNVVYVHGSVDPWHALGIIKTKDSYAPAIYIEGKVSAFLRKCDFIL